MKTVIDPRQVYQDSAVRGATPIELVVLLYDSAIEDMRRALAAMKKGEIEARSAAVGHALMVLQQLQGTLDFERGGRPPGSSNSSTVCSGPSYWRPRSGALPI